MEKEIDLVPIYSMASASAYEYMDYIFSNDDDDELTHEDFSHSLIDFSPYFINIFEDKVLNEVTNKIFVEMVINERPLSNYDSPDSGRVKSSTVLQHATMTEKDFDYIFFIELSSSSVTVPEEDVKNLYKRFGHIIADLEKITENDICMITSWYNSNGLLTCRKERKG